MPKAAFDHLVIAGLGLLGGSIALAARRSGAAKRITAVGRRDYDEPIRTGMIDAYTRDLQAAAAAADLVVLCTPVDKIQQQIASVLSVARPGTIVTDVGSTKGRLVEAAERIEAPACFVGSHPMVGGHLTGWENSTEDLFERGITYVTMTGLTNVEAVARTGAFWESIGARTVYLHPRRHDYLCALLSHVPHMTAVALMQLIAESREDAYALEPLAGSGLRDTTRIAMGSADVWTEICQHNAAEVAALIDRLAGTLSHIAGEVRRADCELKKILTDNAERRRIFEPPHE